MSCEQPFSIAVAPACLELGSTQSQTVPKADGLGTMSPATICYDSTNDVFYCLRGSAPDIFAVDPVLFGQLWFLLVGTGGLSGDSLFIPETGFLYHCNRAVGAGGGLFEINVSAQLISRQRTYTAPQGPPMTLCYRSIDNSIFTAPLLTGGLCKVDISTFTIVATNSGTLSLVNNPLWCPLNDRIYVYGRAGTSPTPGLSCVNPTTLAIEATITNSQTYYKVAAYSPVSEQIYLVRESFPTKELLIIDPLTNTVAQTIDIAAYFPTTPANRMYTCYAFGCNVYIIPSTTTTEYAVLSAKTNTIVASGVWTHIALQMAAGKDTTEGVAFAYNNGFVRITPP